jgi:S-adenosylmethionine synthetase
MRDGGHLVPLRVHTLLISTQHSPDISHADIQRQLMQHVVQPVIPPALLADSTEFFLNPSKRRVLLVVCRARCRLQLARGACRRGAAAQP